MALALVLHAATAAALWWISPLRPYIPTDEAIEVTIERGGAAPEEATKAAPPAEQPPQQQTLAMPQPSPQAPPAPDPPPEPPRPPVEQAVPPPEPAVPPPTAMDFPKPAPPPPPPPQPQAQPPRPPPPRPPTDNQATAPQPSPLHNPADVLIGPGGGGQTEYFTKLARRLAQYRYYPKSSRDAHEEGRVVMRIVIARDGRLLDARIERSSGFPAIDAAELETIRRAAPFPPLPLNIPGERTTFLVPVNYELRDPRVR